MKPSYKYIDHTADILFIAKAPSLEELFVQSALALENSQVDVSLIKPIETKKIEVSHEKIDRLLFDFLDDLVFYKDSELLIFSKFEIIIGKKDGKYHLVCDATGDKLDHAKHDPKVDVKAITMHLFEVKEIEGGWQAQVIIDI